VWENDTLSEEAIELLLDASVVQLTGLQDAGAAWSSLFIPGERVAIKVNSIRSSSFSTHVPLVMATARRLQDVGVPAEQIVIFDRSTSELETVGYPVNVDGPGVRCYGTDASYSSGWAMLDEPIAFSDILLNCDALINMPVLKQHSISGISFAMKNHYGTFDRPGRFHQPRIDRALAELNALAPIQERTRLIIGDVLAVVDQGWHAAKWGDSILMSFDPIAHDAVGLQIFGQTMTPEVELTNTPAYQRATPWLENGAALGLGISDPEKIELVEVQLG
jgi:uncharacterized protein (DUF362 family)